jgi:N12 class adenine-specific DNA methylase
LVDAKWNPADGILQQTRNNGSGKAEARGSLQERAFANENNQGIIKVAEAEGIEEEDVLGLLASGYALLDIEDGGSVLQNEILYYSGNVYQKLDKAKVLDVKAPSEYEPAIQHQIERLEAIKPEPKTLDEIRFKGTEKWIFQLLRDHGVVSWRLDSDRNGVRAWDTGDRILDNYLNSTALVSHATDELASEYAERMRDAEEHISEVYDRLRDRIMDDPLVAKAVEEAYNRRFRNYVKPDYEKARYLVQDVLDEIEANSPIRLRKNQVEWIIQAVYEGKGINAHDVGGGKTFAAITLARVLKKRGVAKKPMFVVPAKTIKKWHRDIKTLFPDAKVVDLGSLSADKRTKALFEMANTNADYVLVSRKGSHRSSSRWNLRCSTSTT